MTPGEERVLALLRTGQSNKLIARELNIQEATVKVHVRRIMKKLHAANRTQAALIAQECADGTTSIDLPSAPAAVRVRPDQQKLEAARVVPGNPSKVQQ